VQVVTGITDETDIEIKSGLKQGDLIVVSMQKTKASSAASSSESRSPFMPKKPGSERTSGK